MKSILVYEDGTIGVRDLPTNCDVYEESIYVPLSTKRTLEPEPNKLSVVRYTRRGKSRKGVPVFCAEGYELKEVAQEIVEARQGKQTARVECERGVQRLIDRDYPNAVLVDLWSGDVELMAAEHDEFARLSLRKVGARMLVAVRVEAPLQTRETDRPGRPEPGHPEVG